ncbi:hypothetical protein K7432_012858 [Basidiobolus ranarum]|uniref:Uncharacterized protein n=1 Tax=Basidiobolus ranarum TaxID=34480 RepID=A0ABR2VRM5_9FUNG
MLTYFACIRSFTLIRPTIQLASRNIQGRPVKIPRRYLTNTVFLRNTPELKPPTNSTKVPSKKKINPSLNESGEIVKKRGFWSQEETDSLLDLVEKNDRNWILIAANIPGRSPTQCAAHYYQKWNPSFKSGRWTVEEVEKLVELVKQYGPKWTFFSKILNRYPAQIRSRWIKCDSPNTKVRKWSLKEKAKLFSLVSKHGEDWEMIRKEFPNYSLNQVRRIWQEELAPEVKKGVWTITEDKILRELVSKMPNRWAEISKAIPGRTAAQCRTWWMLALDPDINFEPWTSEELDILMEEIAINGRSWKAISDKLPGRSQQQCRQRANMLFSKGLGTIFVNHSIGPYARYGWSDSNEFEQRYEDKA